MSQILALKSRLQAFQMSKDVRSHEVAQFFSLCRESVGNKNDANDHSDAKTAVLLPVLPGCYA